MNFIIEKAVKKHRGVGVKAILAVLLLKIGLGKGHPWGTVRGY
jgi:hypothetical protein